MQMEKKNAPRPGSGFWGRCVNYRLREGFGAEDIAVQLHCETGRVRDYIQDLRAAGKLEAVLSGRIKTAVIPAQ